ncbi:MAG: hypothetical protein GEV03_19385 [Streptosporangiales bacterium]|nr:hypothetical protein [Streptosporangiales bacterium]
MARVVLRIRPAEVVADLDLAVVETRAGRLTGWRAEVHDTRLSDATYLSVVVTADEIDDAAAVELRDAFRALPRMAAYVVRAIGDEEPLERADAALLRTAAKAFPA